MQAPDLTIAVAGQEDVNAMIGVLEEAASWLWNRGIRQWEPGSMRTQRRTFRRWTRSNGLVVARSDGDLAGGCFLVDEPMAEWATHSGAAFYLHRLVVARAHAGCGVSAGLLDWCKNRARELGVPRVRLDCWDGNERLRAFYRAAGYRELEAVPSHGFIVRLFELEIEV
jgi:protein-tyrosine phosphatase